MPANQNNQCTLTNKSGKDVTVVVAVGRDETAGSNSFVTPGGQLEILKTMKGTTVIKNGDSDIVTLDHTYQPGTAEKGDVQSYNLIISDTKWLYPLTSLPVEPHSDNGSSVYAPQSLTTIGTAMEQAFAFYQVVSAYPDSKLASDYTTALQAAQDAAIARADGTTNAGDAVAAAIEDTVSAFFRTTKEYGQVTLVDMVAADNYYRNFPAVWAQYKDKLTYYIYSSDDTTAGFAGTLSLEKSGPVDGSRPNGGYACTFEPSVNPSNIHSNEVDNGKAIALTYSKGLFVDDPKAASPKIALKGSFMLASLFTGNPDDNKIIIVMAGNINGKLSIGFDSPQGNVQPVSKTLKAAQTTSSDVEKYWDTLLHPKNQEQLMISVLTLAGAIILIPLMAWAVYGVYRVIKYKVAMKEALSREIVEYTRAEMQGKVTVEVKEISGGWDFRVGQWLGDFYVDFNPKNVGGFYRVVENHALANKLIEAFRLQKEGLEEAMQFAGELPADDVSKIEDALSRIRESIDTLGTSPRTQLEKVLPDQFTAYKEVTSTVMEVYFNLGSKLNEEAKTTLIENSDISRAIVQTVEESFNDKWHEEIEFFDWDSYRPEVF